MKNLLKFRLPMIMIALLSLFILPSCDDEEELTAGPISADFDFAISEDNPLEVTFSALDESENIVAYAWDFGTGDDVSSEENPTFTYETSGEYEVRLIVLNRVGDEEETMQTVTVNLDPAALVPNFTFEVNNLDVSFTNTSEGAVSYEWNFGDGEGTSTETNPQYSYATADDYVVTLTVANADGLEKTFEQTVTTNEPPAATADFSVSIEDLTVTFTNNSENAVSYAWDFGDGTGTSTEENPVYTYSTTGTYAVSLTATAENGETDVATIDVVLEEENPLFTPGNNNYFDRFSGVAGDDNIGNWTQATFAGVKPELTRGVENPDPNDTSRPLVGKYERVLTGETAGNDAKFIRILANPSDIPLTWDERTTFSIRVYMPSENDPDNTDLERKVAFKLRSGGANTEISVSTTLEASADNNWTTVELDMANATGNGLTFDPTVNYSSFIIQLGGENEIEGRGYWFISDFVRL